MKPYRSKKHPKPQRLSRGLRSLPPPAPRTGRRRIEIGESHWLHVARRELHEAALRMYAAAHAFRTMRMQLEEQAR